jgi:hypothetical protein
MDSFHGGYRNRTSDCINIEVEQVDHWNAALRARFSIMNSDRVFEATIRTAKNLLGQNLQPTQLPDAATVLLLRELVHSPSIRSALLHSSDTLLAFALRAVEHVVADHLRPIERS